MYNPIKAGQQINVMVADYAEITVRRPNGSVETIKHPTGKEITGPMFEAAKKATKAAGRGELISYRNVKKAATYTVTAADAATDSTAQIERLMTAGE